MSNAYNRIHLSGEAVHEEAIAAGVIKPGHLIALDLNSKAAVHGTAAGPAELAVALEDALQGNDIDDSYAADDRVSYAILERGSRAYMYLAAGESVTPADYLTSNGDGTLKKAAGTDTRLFKAMETLDLSASSAVDTRMVVRAL